MILLNLLIYIVAFFLIWYGAGLIVSAASKFSQRLKLSPFIFSFAFLGVLTSIPEFSVGMQSVAENKPEIFVGNLLGGIISLFLVVIPILAIFGKGINLKHELSNNMLLMTLGVILLPSVFLLDKRVTSLEGIVLMLAYIGMLYLVQRKHGIFDSENERLFSARTYSLGDFLKIVLGIGIVFVSSNLIVERTLYFTDVFNTSAFYISLIVIGLGTNLPELTLALRSVAAGKKDLAMGDYIGSAAFNTFLFGLFTLLNNGEILTVSNFFVTVLFILFALGLFYFFSRKAQYISQKNGLFLLSIYILFIVFELL